MWYCCLCTVLVAIGTCCSSAHSKSHNKGISSERPGRVESCLIFFVFGYTKCPPVPFWLLEVPFPEFIYAKDKRGLWADHNGVPFLLVPSSSPQPSMQMILGSPLSLQRSSWVLCPYILMAPMYTVHQCLPKPYTSTGLMCQIVESTQSHTPGHRFPPSG